jgi:hypothetical protein
MSRFQSSEAVLLIVNCFVVVYGSAWHNLAAVVDLVWWIALQVAALESLLYVEG